MLNFDDIAPRADGKYSPRLHRFLTGKKAEARRFNRVYQAGSMIDRTVHRDRWAPREIIIGSAGDNGYVSGRDLGSIIIGARGTQAMTFAFPAGTPGFNLREITEQFWAEYLRDGRCVWDRAHSVGMINDDGRFDTVGDTRCCNWCGAVQRLSSVAEVVVERKTIWVPFDQQTGAATANFPAGSMGEEVAL